MRNLTWFPLKFLHTLAAIFCLSSLIASVSAGATGVPTKDLPGISDPDGLKRYAGAVLIYRDEVAYDELKFPVSKTTTKDDKQVAPKSIERTGTRNALQYITPPGKSSLEVVRNYQQELKAAGFTSIYDCAADACGDASWMRDGYFMSLVAPQTYWAKIDDNSPAACGGGANTTDFRYTVLENKATGVTIMVAAWRSGDVSVYCEEAEFKKRTSVFVVKVEPKAREQSMEAISASEIKQSLDANGKIALYGILFDSNKADIKPESKASLDQIGTLLKQQPKIKLHVVGHTDNVGSLAANIDLSKRRAEAVAAALARDYGIARDRLTANGVASLAPVASNDNDGGKAKNRRVELVLQ